MAKVIIWLHSGERRYRLPVDITHANITSEAIHAVRGTTIWCIPHTNPRDVTVHPLRGRTRKGTWRAIDRGRFNVHGALDHSEVAGRVRGSA